MCHFLIREALENEHESFALDKSAEGSQFFLIQKFLVPIDPLGSEPSTADDIFSKIRSRPE
jgi:hypothetical protein